MVRDLELLVGKRRFDMEQCARGLLVSGKHSLAGFASAFWMVCTPNTSIHLDNPLRRSMQSSLSQLVGTMFDCGEASEGDGAAATAWVLAPPALGP